MLVSGDVEKRKGKSVTEEKATVWVF